MGRQPVEPGKRNLSLRTDQSGSRRRGSQKAQESARALFSGGNHADMPAAEITEADLRDGVIDIMGLLVSAGLCASRSEARRAVEQGGVTVNGEKVTDIKTTYTPDDIKNAEEFVLKRGKKKFCKIVMK